MITPIKIKPLFTSIVTTMEKYGIDEVDSTIIDPSKVQGALKEIQKVVAVGSAVHEISEGDYVKINPKKYAVRKFREDSVKNDLMNNEIVGFNIPQVEMDGQTYLLLQVNDIEYVITEWREDQPDSGIIHQEPSIIIP